MQALPRRIALDFRDVFSKGFICPKGVSLKELHDDLGTKLRQDGDEYGATTGREAAAERLPFLDDRAHRHLDYEKAASAIFTVTSASWRVSL